MRVITGKAKRTPLISKDPRTVPLSDRAKSALFDIINIKIPNSSVLDLYAGSGALGIECLSRGAATVQFVDVANNAIESIKENLKRTKLEEGADILRLKAEKYVSKYTYDKYDIIFVCPPYPAVNYHVVRLASEMLNDEGLLIFEHHKKDKYKELENIKKIDERRYGIVTFEIYQKLLY